MRLKLHEFELLCSIAYKTGLSKDFQEYESEFLFDIADRTKQNKKQKRELI
jgi:hypothetical protein